MQIGTELVVISSITTVLISAVIGAYLGRKWLSQEVRLLTDLPLVFAIAFVSQSFNIMIVTLQHIGLLQTTMILFRIRSVAIGGSIIPILGAILQIWTPSIQKYHNRIVFLLGLYWVLIALLGSHEELIMILTIPVMIILGIMMMFTFIITWRTGRLKEVRSELMIISVLFGMASQILRVPLLSTSLFYVPDVLLTISMVLTAIAFANPWYHRETKNRLETSLYMVEIPE
ncbi:MAG: hypothetical protein AM325_011580 [Candidatus Thorarchaeota archaeon SMTZ1-45]|nr:MAG: hypothetical protein AM325_13270 [Candidatus Thorarchaeota archaeon SMTZ1-45]